MNPHSLGAFIEIEMKGGATQSEAIALAAVLEGRPISHSEVLQAMAANPRAFPQAVDYKRLIR